MSFDITKVSNLQKSTLQFLYEEYKRIPNNFGGVLLNLNYAWLVRKSKVVVVNCKNGFKVGSWDFANTLQDDSVEINAVQEMQRPNGKESHLVISLNCQSKGGIICIFDFVGSKVIRAIRVGEQITNIHVIDKEQDSFSLSASLINFDGVLAVGTVGGSVFLLDICRQLCYEGFNSFEAHDELNPCQMQVITSENLPHIENLKLEALDNESHLAIFLNVVHNKKTEHFVLKNPDGSDSVHVNEEEVLISALHYCPQLGSILVGYNFGAYQLWNLMTMELVYTSPICEQHIPIVKFAVQEPADDPRAFCYVWAVYNSDDMESLPFLVMFGLCYKSKEFHENYGLLYVNFQYCTIRFERELGFGTNNSNLKPIGGKCLKLDSFVLKNPSANNEICGNDGAEDALSLCVSAWKVVCSDGEFTYISIFDLNQWYKAQLPSSSSYDDCASYLITLRISDLIETENENGMEILDITLNKKTIQQFIGIQRLEEHYYPSSLSFETTCLLEYKILNIRYQGVQAALLSQLQTSGSLCLVRPSNTYQEIITLGLTPLFGELNTSSAITSLNDQREVILNVALEQQLINWLCKCASDWANGSFSSAGCSLELLTSWAFRRAVTLKRKCENLCIPLFDYSVVKLDANTINILSNCIRQIKNISFVFSFIMNKLSSNLANKDKISKNYKNLQLIELYFDVLQWFVNVSLLPECSSATTDSIEDDENQTPYPVEKLEEYYEKRRTELLLGVNKRFTSKKSILFIDNLIEEECGGKHLIKDWEQFGGDGHYPPSSLQALLRTYLLDDIDVCYKHSVIMYLLLDLAATLDVRYKTALANLVKFPAVFKVTPSFIKIAHAFWQLDHGDFLSAMDNLLDPMVNQEDLKNWHHKVALKSLLVQEQHNLALLYMNVRKPPIVDDEDVLCAISLFISNNMLDEAFYLEKNYHNHTNSQIILTHLFAECNNYGRLNSIIYRNLTNEEERYFLKYLDEVKHPEASDLKVTYFMQRSHYIEAFKTYQACEEDPMKKGLISRLNLKARDQIIHTYKKFLPTVSYNFIETCIKEPNPTLWKEASLPKPMSVCVREADNKTEYKSSLILAALAKAKLTFNDNVNNLSLMNATTEEIPFLRTPTSIPSNNKRSSVQVIIPKIVITEEEEEDGPSPPKRSKLSFSNLSQELDLNSSLMSTPIIARKQRSYVSPIPSRARDVTATPTSILKVRNSFKDFSSDPLSAPLNTTPHMSSLSGRRPTRASIVKFDVPSSPSEEQSSASNMPSSETAPPTPESFANSSRSTSHSITTKNVSDTDEYYSPNASLDNIDELPKDKSTDEKNEAYETQGFTPKISPKKQPVISKAERVKLVDYDPSSSSREETDSSMLSSPRCRRSYKKLPSDVTPVRSSPRLSKGSGSLVAKRERGGSDYPMPDKEDVPFLPLSIGGKSKKSLNRKVLEANMLARLTSDMDSTETTQTEIHTEETKKMTTIVNDGVTELSHTKVEYSNKSYTYTAETTMDSDIQTSCDKLNCDEDSPKSGPSDSLIEMLYEDLITRTSRVNASSGISSASKKEVSKDFVHTTSYPRLNENQSLAISVTQKGNSHQQTTIKDNISLPSTSSGNRNSLSQALKPQLATAAESEQTAITKISKEDKEISNLNNDFTKNEKSENSNIDSGSSQSSNVMPRCSSASDSFLEMLYNDLCERRYEEFALKSATENLKEVSSKNPSGITRPPLRITRRLSTRLSEDRRLSDSIQLQNKNELKLFENKNQNVLMDTPKRATAQKRSLISTESSNSGTPSKGFEESILTSDEQNLSESTYMKIEDSSMKKTNHPLSRQVLESNALSRIISEKGTSSNEDTESKNLNDDFENVEKRNKTMLSDSLLEEIAWGTLPKEKELLEKYASYAFSQRKQDSESQENVCMENKTNQNSPDIIEISDLSNQTPLKSTATKQLNSLRIENATPSVFERNIVESDMESFNESSNDSNKKSNPEINVIEISSSDDMETVAPTCENNDPVFTDKNQQNPENYSDLIYGDLSEEDVKEAEIDDSKSIHVAHSEVENTSSVILVCESSCERADTENNTCSYPEITSQNLESEENAVGDEIIQKNISSKEQSVLGFDDKNKSVRRMTRRLSKQLDDKENENISLEQSNEPQNEDEQKTSTQRGSISKASYLTSKSSLNLNVTSSSVNPVPESMVETSRSINTRKRTRSVDMPLTPKLEDSIESTSKASGTIRARRKLRSASVDVPTTVNEDVENESLIARKNKKKPSSLSGVDVKEGKKNNRKSLEILKEDLVENFKTTRRLTRRQSNILEQTLDKIDLSVIEHQDPIALLDKTDFKGTPDPSEEKVYKTSPTSSSVKSSISRPARRTSRVSSNASDDSTASIKSGRRKVPVIPAEPQTGTRRKLRSSSIDEESKPMEKSYDISDDSAESDTSVISTRSRKSNPDDSTNSTKRKRKVTSKSVLPKIKEENAEGVKGSPAQNTRHGKKNTQK